MSNEIYVTPLSGRYASKEMNKIWSSDAQYSTWRKLWVALAETEKELGIDITEELVDKVILKEKKTVQEMIDTCPDNRKDLLEDVFRLERLLLQQLRCLSL